MTRPAKLILVSLIYALAFLSLPVVAISLSADEAPASNRNPLMPDAATHAQLESKVSDLRSKLTALKALPPVDPAKIAIWIQAIEAILADVEPLLHPAGGK